MVDALDECEVDDDIRLILRLLAEAKALETVRLRIFITSRPETPIRLGFREMLEIVHHDLVLHFVPQPVIEHDISIFLRHELAEIKKMRSLEEDWPGEERIQKLLQKADRLFIYAATICRFISKSRFPESRLSEILQVTSVNHSSTKKLDEMYMLILNYSVAGACDEDKEDVARLFKQIVGSIITLFNTLSTTALTKLLAVSSAQMDETLEPLYSVLDIPQDKTSPIQLFHLSFRDFLLNNERCCDIQFWIDEKNAHNYLSMRCLKLMSEHLRKDMCGLRMPGALAAEVEKKMVEHHLPLAVQYACRYWISHLQRGNIELCDNGQVHEFLTEHFLHWIEALSLMRNMSDAVVMVRGLESLLIVRNSTKSRFVLLANLAKSQPNTTTLLLTMIQDAKRFILYNRSIIEKAPLQVYTSALVFSPRSTIRTLFQNEEPSWIKSSLTLGENWSPCLQTLEGHMNSVYSVMFSHDGRRLASGSLDNTIRIWDAETGALQQTLEGHTRSVFSVMFSHDSQRLVSGSADRAVRIWDAETGTLQQTLEGHTDWVYSVTFSHDGWRLASGSADRTVRIWDAETGTPWQTLKGHTGLVHSVMFSHDDQRLVSGSADRAVRIWDVETGMLQQTLEGHRDIVYSVTFSHDGRRLASGSEDYTIRIWDAETGTLQQTLKGHTNSVFSVTFFHNSQRLASGSLDNTIRIWDAVIGTLQQTLEGHTSGVFSVTFSHNSRRLASSSADRTVRIWDAKTSTLQQTLKGHTGSVRSVTFSHDGRRLTSASYDYTARIWDAETGTLQQTLKGHTGWVCSVMFSDDDQRLASGSADRTIRIWDVETGTLQQTLEGHTKIVYSVTFSHDGRRLASGSSDWTIRIWDVETGTLQQTLEAHTSLSLAFSHNGRRLVSGSHGHKIRIWDAETGTLQQTLKGHTSSVLSVTFSHNDQRLASSSADREVRIWDAETGALQQTLEIGSPLRNLFFSLDDLHLITEFGSILLSQSSSLHTRTPNWSGYCVSSSCSWITWNGNKVLWLPPEYRPKSSMVKKQTIAIGCASGQVFLIKFNSNNSPVEDKPFCY